MFRYIFLTFITNLTVGFDSFDHILKDSDKIILKKQTLWDIPTKYSHLPRIQTFYFPDLQIS